MSTELDIRPEQDTICHDDDLHHIFCCCSPTISLCGLDVGDDDEYPLCGDECDEELCEPCGALEFDTCILCGVGPHSNRCFCGTCL